MQAILIKKVKSLSILCIKDKKVFWIFSSFNDGSQGKPRRHSTYYFRCFTFIQIAATTAFAVALAYLLPSFPFRALFIGRDRKICYAIFMCRAQGLEDNESPNYYNRFLCPVSFGSKCQENAVKFYTSAISSEITSGFRMYAIFLWFYAW